MDPSYIIRDLSRNRKVFHELLKEIPDEQVKWKPAEDKWSLLEIVCHLYDEEREDFRVRLKHVLNATAGAPPSINPAGWVTERKYMERNYTEMLNLFLEEREQSITWLQSLNAPAWNNAYDHPKWGKMTAELFLVNWLAHDLLHLRQILAVKHNYLSLQSSETLEYAGTW